MMYLWTILHSDSSELRRKIYDMQQYKAIKGDWRKLVDKKKTKYDINLSDSEIFEMSRERFENLIKRKIRSSAAQNL